MFDLLTTAESAAGAGAVGEWARVENAACARKLSAMFGVLEARLAADGAVEREQWCLDNWSAVCAEIAAAQGLSGGVVSNQLLVAKALHERLPRVEQLLTAGDLSYRLASVIVTRTSLATDPETMAKIDAAIAEHLHRWRGWSEAKIEKAIDYWVDRFDPHALRRTEVRARSRGVIVDRRSNGDGLSAISGDLYATDAAVLDERLDAMAKAVCDGDPRTLDQRRADALGALAGGADRLACACGESECPAADASPGAVVIHVVADADTVEDTTAAALDGEDPQPRDINATTTIAEAFAPDPPTEPSPCNPALLIGGTIMSAPLAAALAQRAVVRTIVHPGAAGPEPRYTPSTALAEFVRCRDLTCRFPGCDAPAFDCDIDHTIPWPVGPTQASNLKCLCRRHHLLKSFWCGPAGWSDSQLPDGTVIWTAPGGFTYTTHPGSRLFFPALTRPTAPVAVDAADIPAPSPARGLMMPRRRQTRAIDREQRINAERAKNDIYARERLKPPTF